MPYVHEANNNLALATFLPDGTAVVRQWIISDEQAEWLRPKLEEAFGTPSAESLYGPGDIAEVRAHADTQDGPVHVFNFGEGRDDAT